MSDQLLVDCGGPFDLGPENMISCWESEPTSGAEVAIMRYLLSEPSFYVNKRILHVGTGNGDFAKAFASDVADYVGLTISVPEIRLFEELFPSRGNASVLLVNKYDHRMYANIEGEFDIIVDTLLKTYACCEKHFLEMMAFFASRLSNSGMIVTTQSGVEFGWAGNVKRAYTPGAQLDPAISQYRRVGVEGLRDIGKNLGLEFDSALSSYTQGSKEIPDRILMLRKGTAL